MSDKKTSITGKGLTLTDKIKCDCGICCACLDIKKGDYVERVGDDGKYYEYEVSDISEDGKTMDIGTDNAYPEFAFIMADDCIVTKRNDR